MPLLTAANLRTRQAGAGAIVAGIIGLLTVVVTNIDKLMDAYRYFVSDNTEAKRAEGSWLGIFKEYDPKKDYVVSTEAVNLTAGLKGISGTVDVQNPVKHHEIKGNAKNGFLTVVYEDSIGNRSGAVVYVLRGDAQSGTLVGFWTGYDPDKDSIMSCPYVLTRLRDTDEAKKRFRDYLQKPCTE